MLGHQIRPYLKISKNNKKYKTVNFVISQDFDVYNLLEWLD